MTKDGPDVPRARAAAAAATPQVNAQAFGGRSGLPWATLGGAERGDDPMATRTQRSMRSLWRCPAAAAVLAVTAVLSAGGGASAQPLAPDEVPEPLRPWVPWVLDGEATYGCTLLGEEPLCTWPGALRLDVGAAGGRFALEVVADREVRVRLPGSDEHFPREVRIDGRPSPVLDGEEGPAVRVGPGAHRVEGTFRWRTLPDLLPVPPSVARVALVLEGEPVRSPRREETGAVWVARAAQGEATEGHFEMEVFRRIDDGVPFRVTTHLAVRASGEPREIALGNVLLPDTVPSSVDSDLAVRLRPDGSLTAQVHAGSFTIEVGAVAAAPPESLAPVEQPEPWPTAEIWVWAADESLRQVEIAGAPSVDPARTNLPGDWRSYPAYALGAGRALAFATTRRGEPMPPPNSLTLARELWLDLDGEGYTVRDGLAGRMSHGYRLDLAEGELGHVVVAGRDQLVTTLDGKDGVELRTRDLDVRAEWRLPGASAELPAVAWSEDVQRLSATVHLPPGYGLLAASGVDEAPGTWVEQWDLWGLFFVVLLSLAVGRLFGWKWGALALPMLVLCYHESGAPLATWVALAAVAGLRTVWTKGRFAPRVLRGAFWVTVAVLVLVAVPFAAQQAKLALFPQTEARYARPGVAAGLLTLGAMADGAEMAPAEEPMYRPEAPAPAAQGLAEAEETAGERRREVVADDEGLFGGEIDLASRSQTGAGSAFDRRGGWIDPNEVIQTGPGVPEWSFRSWSLEWSGPVAKEHRIRLWLLSPAMSRLMAVLRVLLLGVLIVVVVRHRFRGRGDAGAPVAAGAAAALALLSALAAPTSAEAQALPDDARLEQLRERLSRPPECVPSCVVASELAVRVTGDRVALEAVVHAAARAAYRVPGPADAWVPETIQVDGRPDAGLVRFGDGFLFLRLEPGVHRVRMEGPIPTRDALTLAFGEPPRSIEVDAAGWEVEGVRADGRPSESIELRRTIRAGSDEAADQLPLVSWLTVRRRLDVGVRWTLETTVERVTPTGSAVVVRIPLLEGESVTEAGMLTEGGEVVVTLGRDDTTRTWTSVIEPREELALSAPEEVRWSESWTLACSPIWRCETEGLAPVRHDAEGVWEPTWKPWPGEELSMRFSRPEAAEGQSVTVDRASLTWRPGTRMLDATLEATIRTSSGGAQVLTLPEGARVQSLEVDGAARPVQLEDRRLRVTLQPGSQTVRVTWQEPRGLGASFTPSKVELGADAVNARVEVELPHDRWLLWASGPSWGAAVLFWPYLIIVLLVAVLLARTRRSGVPAQNLALLGLGLTQIPAWAAMIVVGWFFAFEHRRRSTGLAAGWFDLRQLALAFYTLVALGCLYGAVHAGLLLDPEMEVFTPGGGGSRHLDWYTDRVGGAMPSVWVLSLPLWIWRVVMLAWALWLALRVIRWAKWSWRCWSEGGVWKRLVSPPRPGPVPAVAAAAAAVPAAPEGATEGDDTGGEEPKDD